MTQPPTGDDRHGSQPWQNGPGPQQWQNTGGAPGYGQYPQSGPQQPGYPGPGYQQQPPKKKGGCLKIGLIVLAVLVVLGIVIAAVSGGDDDSAKVSSGGTSESSDSKNEAGGGVDFKGKTGKDTGAIAGETITQKNISITTTPLQAQHPDYQAPQLCTTITVKNDGDKQKAFNMFDWKMQDPNGAAKSGMPPLDNSGSGFNFGELAPGGQITGDLCFDGDPSAVPGQYVVLYQGSILSSDRLGWVNQL